MTPADYMNKVDMK